MIPIKPPTYHCLRCHAEWSPRIPRLPLECPRCKSYDWRIPYSAVTALPSARRKRQLLACAHCRALYGLPPLPSTTADPVQSEIAAPRATIRRSTGKATRVGGRPRKAPRHVGYDYADDVQPPETP